MYKTREISNSDDVVDSRDVIKRIEELQDEHEDLKSALDELKEELAGLDESKDADEIKDIKAQIESAEKGIKEWDESDEGEELKALLNLQEQAEGYAPDWTDGASLIRDSYMDEDWAEQELQDLGYLPKDLPNILSSNIDWKGVLSDLKQDYTSVDWDGVTYWIR